MKKMWLWTGMIVDAEEKKEYARMLSKILLHQDKFVLQGGKIVDIINRERTMRHCNLNLIKEGREN